MLAYTLNYSNASDTTPPTNQGQNAVNVALTEIVPANTTFNPAASTAGWSCTPNNNAGSTCSLSIGSLADGAGGSATFAVNIAAALPAGVTLVDNTSAGISENPNVNGPDRNTANNAATDTTNIIGNWDGSAGAGGFGNWNVAANWSNDVIPTGNVSIPDVANRPQVTTPVTVANLVLNGENVNIDAAGTITVSGSVVLGANMVDGGGTLSLGPTATISRTTGQVNAILQKTFAANGPFTFPVGTTGAYSPVNVDITSGGTLSVKANTGTVAPLNPAVTLQRYWTMNGVGGVTADVTFNYLQSDVAGTETNYRIVRVEGGGPVPFPNSPTCPANNGTICVNPTLNTMFIADLSSFSDWTASELAPTAAGVSVSGRVTNVHGQGISRAFVTITDPISGFHMQVITNSFGRFRFTDVPPGGTAVITVMHSRYLFENSTQVVQWVDNVNGVMFVGTRP